MWLLRNIIWINIIFAALLIFFERRNPTSTWLWLMVLTFIPGFGFLLYLFLGQDLSKVKMFKNKQEYDYRLTDKFISEEDMIRDNKRYKRQDFLKYIDLIKMHIKSSEAFFTQDNEIDVYFNGHDKFKALLNSIENAQEYVYLQYYIIKSDELSMKVINALCKKAEEGLDVKLLYDGMGGRKVKKHVLKQMKDSGVKVAVFFPPFAAKMTLRINYRNHRKMAIIDGKEAYIGGYNIGDEYIGLSKKFGYWRDTHLKIEGSAVSSIQWRFDLDWRFASGQEEGLNRASRIVDREENGSSGVQIVSSGPDSTWPSVKDGYLKMISDAKDKLYIETPYFIPDDSILEALRLAGLAGLDVRVMIPCKPDHPFVYWASLSYIGELLKAGVKFYTYERGFLHSKVVIMDDFVSSVGTANLDIRSFQLNFEVNAFVYDSELNRKLTNNFIDDLKYCKEITKEDYRNRSNWVKLKESFSRLLSPIL